MELIDHDKRVIDIARRIANDAPQRQGKHVFRAGVRWDLIHELRAAIWDRDEWRRHEQ